MLDPASSSKFKRKPLPQWVFFSRRYRFGHHSLTNFVFPLLVFHFFLLRKVDYWLGLIVVKTWSFSINIVSFSACGRPSQRMHANKSEICWHLFRMINFLCIRKSLLQKKKKKKNKTHRFFIPTFCGATAPTYQNKPHCLSWACLWVPPSSPNTASYSTCEGFF